MTELWSHLLESPLPGLCLTLGAYLTGRLISHRFNNAALASPVLIAILLVCLVLWASQWPYEAYFEGAKFIHFLLGPATVALAIPLYNNLHHIKRAFWAVMIAVVLGGVFAILSGVGLAWSLGASPQTILSLAPKAVTTPVAMGIAEIIGGLPALSAVLVILSGITGAVLGGAVLTLVRIRDQKARGLAVGISSHGIGTARQLSLNETAGAFAGLGMGLNALATALLIPVLFAFYKWIA